MCKTKEAQAFLENYETLVFRLKEKTEEKNAWLNTATKTTSQMSEDRVQTSSDQQKMESAIIKYLGIDEQIAAICDKIKEIESVLEQLSGEKYKVAYYRYCKGLTYAEIGDRCDKTEGWATTTHGRALQDVQRILEYGRKKRLSV